MTCIFIKYNFCEYYKGEGTERDVRGGAMTPKQCQKFFARNKEEKRVDFWSSLPSLVFHDPLERGIKGMASTASVVNSVRDPTRFPKEELTVR